MELEASPRHRRDSFIVAGALALLGCLWLALRLYWQGALLVGAALALGAHGRRLGAQPLAKPGRPARGEAPEASAQKVTARKTAELKATEQMTSEPTAATQAAPKKKAPEQKAPDEKASLASGPGKGKGRKRR